MTNKQWNEILKDLHSFRISDNLNNPIRYTDSSSGLSDVEIDEIDINKEYILLKHDKLLKHEKYISHNDMFNISAKEMRSRFYVVMNAVEFKIGE